MTRSLQMEPNGQAEEKKVDVAPRQKTAFEELLDKDFVSNGMQNLAIEGKAFEQRQRKAALYAASDVVPSHFRGKMPNCYIACEIAERLRVSDLLVMQNTYVIQGKLGFQAQFAIAVINASNAFDEPLEFEIQCDDAEGNPKDPSYQVRCSATRKGKKRAIKGPWVTWAMIKAEGWSEKMGSKWNTLTDLMFRYRAAAFFARTVCPELLMGFQTVEELEDIAGDNAVLPPTQRSKRSLQSADTGPADDGPTAGAASKTVPPVHGGGLVQPSSAAPADSESAPFTTVAVHPPQGGEVPSQASPAAPVGGSEQEKPFLSPEEAADEHVSTMDVATLRANLKNTPVASVQAARRKVQIPLAVSLDALPEDAVKKLARQVFIDSKR